MRAGAACPRRTLIGPLCIALLGLARPSVAAPDAPWRSVSLWAHESGDWVALDGAPLRHVGPARATLTSNVTSFAEQVCSSSAVRGVACSADAAIALTSTVACAPQRVARLLRAVGCRGVVLVTENAPPGLGFVFSMPIDLADEAGDLRDVQVHALSPGSFDRVRSAAATGGGAVVRLEKSPELIDANPWVVMGDGVAYLVLARAGCTLLSAVGLSFGCVQLGRSYVDFRREAAAAAAVPAGSRSWWRVHVRALSELRLAHTVVLLETWSFLALTARHVLIFWGGYALPDADPERMIWTAFWVTTGSSLLIVVFWRDAFQLRRARGGLCARNCRTLSLLVPFAALVPVVALLRRRMEPKQHYLLRRSVMGFLTAVLTVCLVALLVYGMRVRVLMQRRVAQLREQQRVLELGASSRPLSVELMGSAAEERYTVAIARMTRLMVAWGVYLVATFLLGVLRLDAGTPAMFFANRVAFIVAHAAQGLTKMHMFQRQPPERQQARQQPPSAPADSAGGGSRGGGHTHAATMWAPVAQRSESHGGSETTSQRHESPGSEAVTAWGAATTVAAGGQ